MPAQLQFPTNPNAYYENPYVSISYSGPSEVISVGPLENTGNSDGEASMLLWSCPPATSISKTTAVAVALNAGPYVVTPGGNALIQQLIHPAGPWANWSCTPQIPFMGSFCLFAQGVLPGVAPTWSPFSPINALHLITLTDAVKQSLLVHEPLAPEPSVGLQSSPPGGDVFFAFGILHDHPGDRRMRLIVDSIVEVDEYLRKLPLIARVLRDRSPAEPEQLGCVLGHERIVPPPSPLAGPTRLQYTGVIAADTHRRLRASDSSREHSIELERGELRQGILELRKRKVTDLSLIRVRLELASERTLLGGFVLVA